MSSQQSFRVKKPVMVVVFIILSTMMVLLSPNFAWSMTRLGDQDLKDVAARGIVLDMDFKLSASRLYLSDRDGCPTAIPGCNETAGVLQLGDLLSQGGTNSDVFIGDSEIDSALTLEGLRLNLDANNKLVVDFPTFGSSFFNLDVVADPFKVGSETENSFARLKINDIQMGNTTLALEGLNGGFQVDGQFDFVAENFIIEDQNGVNGSGNNGQFSFNGLSFGGPNDPSNPMDLTGITINADQSTDFSTPLGNLGGVVVKVPTSNSFGMEIEGIDPANGEALGMSLRNASIINRSATVKIGGDPGTR